MVLGLASFIVQSHVSVFVSVQNFLKSLWKKKKIILSFLISVASSYELITLPPNQKRGNKTDTDITKEISLLLCSFGVHQISKPCMWKPVGTRVSTTRGPQENRPKQRQTDEIWTKKKKKACWNRLNPQQITSTVFSKSGTVTQKSTKLSTSLFPACIRRLKLNTGV